MQWIAVWNVMLGSRVRITVEFVYEQITLWKVWIHLCLPLMGKSQSKLVGNHSKIGETLLKSFGHHHAIFPKKHHCCPYESQGLWKSGLLSTSCPVPIDSESVLPAPGIELTMKTNSPTKVLILKGNKVETLQYHEDKEL